MCVCLYVHTQMHMHYIMCGYDIHYLYTHALYICKYIGLASLSDVQNSLSSPEMGLSEKMVQMLIKKYSEVRDRCSCVYMHLFLFLSLLLGVSFCLCVCLSVLSVCLSVYQSIYLSVYANTHVYSHIYTYTCTYTHMHMYAHHAHTQGVENVHTRRVSPPSTHTHTHRRNWMMGSMGRRRWR